MAKPPFDPVKASFYLVAAVIGTYIVVALATAGACLYYADQVVGTSLRCDPEGKLTELLAAALAAALAFAGGRLPGTRDPDDDEPPKRPEPPEPPEPRL